MSFLYHLSKYLEFICQCMQLIWQFLFQSSYPAVISGYRFLCSGGKNHYHSFHESYVSTQKSSMLRFIFLLILLGIIGYAPMFNEVVNFEEIGNTDDDQLYYTRIYLKHRVRLIILHNCPFFITVHEKTSFLQDRRPSGKDWFYKLISTSNNNQIQGLNSNWNKLLHFWVAKSCR